MWILPKTHELYFHFAQGIGGLERGIERVIGKMRIAAYVEIEAFICENLATAMEKGVLAPAPIWSNLKTFDALPFRNKIHGILGGYPCQPFSVAGHRNGVLDPRHLYPYIAGCIEASRPHWCFFENVAGHLKLGYDSVYKSLHSMGYNVEPGIFSAEEVGATHQRKRLFILAIKRDQLEHTQSWWARRLSHSLSTREGHGATGASPVLQREDVDNASSNRFKSQHKVQTGRNSIIFAGQKLAHASHASHAGLQGDERG